MRKIVIFFFVVSLLSGVCIDFIEASGINKKQALPGYQHKSPQIKVVYKSRPFYFRFPPKLKDIKSKKVIMAKMEYEHPELGACTYEMVKDLQKGTFLGWCNSKKIPRRKTQIFDIDEDFKGLEVTSEHGAELGLNEHAKAIIEKINQKQAEQMSVNRTK